MKEVVLQTIHNGVVVHAQKYRSIRAMCQDIGVKQSTVCMMLRDDRVEGKRYRSTKALQDKRIIILKDDMNEKDVRGEV